MGAKLYICYLDDTFRDKAFCHMIIIQEVLLLALCKGMTEQNTYKLSRQESVKLEDGLLGYT